MTIGQLAKACGVGVETIRFYERQGLLTDPRKRGVGYRDYPDEAVRRVRFVKQAQALGFTLKEIADLLDLRVSPETTCADVRAKARARVLDVQDKIATLRTFEAALQRLVSQCSGTGPVSDCPILDAIDADSPPDAPTVGARRREEDRG